MKGKQTILGRIATYVNDKVDTSLLDNSTYISTDSMLPNVGGIINSVNLPKGKVTAFKKGDILYSNIRPYFRKVWHAEFDGGCSNDVLVIRAKDGINSNYLFCLLSTTNFSEYVMGGSNGTKMPRGNKNFTLTYPINLPATHDQNRMATILSRYDELIEINNRRIALLEKNASELYKEWFVRFRFPGWEKVKFDNGLPEGWATDRIDSFYNTGSGGTPNTNNKAFYENGNINWLRTGELNDGFIFDTEIKISEQGLKLSSAKIYSSNSVVIAMYGMTIGQLGILSKPMAVNQACCVLYPKTDNYGYEFIYFSLLYNRQNLIGFSNGAAQQNISQEEIKRYKIIIPPTDIIKMFNKKVDIELRAIETLSYQNSLLSTQRDCLIPRLLSGELAV